MSVADALLATLASPPLFAPMSTLKGSTIFEYIGADFTLSNPCREIIFEAHNAFGADGKVACLLSLGCGHPGITSMPKGHELSGWNQVMEKLLRSNDQEAQNFDIQLGHLGFYYRFTVSHGLETTSEGVALPQGDVIAHTAAYIADASVSRKLEQCVDLLTLRDGSVLLKDLSDSQFTTSNSPY